MKRATVRIALLPILFCANVSAQTWWPMQGQNAQRTGRSTAFGPASATLKWTYDFNDVLSDNASPVVGPDGTIYQVMRSSLSVDGRALFYAIYPNGTMKWSTGALGGFGMTSAPGLSSDGYTAYVLTEDLTNYLTALDVHNPDIFAISAGQDYSMALKQNGTVWTWGDNSSGQLGIGNNDDKLTPVRIQSINDVMAIMSGYEHALALKRDGTIWSWGENTSGQLGSGNTINSNVPVSVSNLTQAVALAAGGSHSLALRQDSTVWAWGANGSGQLGTGNTTSSLIPVQVLNLTHVIAVDAGNAFSLALREDGTVWAWGNNFEGQLGTGDNTHHTSPVQVSNISNVRAIAAGDNYALALRQDGTVWAWGDNLDGQLGTGNNNDSKIPMQVINLTNVKMIAAHHGNPLAHNLALLQDGSVWAWGRNFYGQLGDETLPDTNQPVQIKTISHVKAISAGGTHSLALKQDGILWGWGDNTDGQAGNFLRTDIVGKVGAVLWLLWQSQIDRVNYSSIAVHPDGTIYLGTLDVSKPTRMNAFNPDGSLKWSWVSPRADCAIEAPPAVDRAGNVYFMHNCEGIVALDANGQLKWKGIAAADWFSWPTPTIGPEGTIYFHYPAYYDKRFFAVNPDGTIQWQRTDIGDAGFFKGVAMSANGSTLYTAADGKVMALDAATGTTIWSNAIADQNEEFGGSPVLSGNGILYFMGYGDKVYAVSSLDGALLWQYQLNTSSEYWGPQSPALGPDGTLYVIASGDKPNKIPARLYAFYTPPTPPAAPILLSPANGAINQPLAATLSWKASLGADSYSLQVATDSLFNTTVFDFPTLSAISQSIEQLANNTTYYWRVNAKNIVGPSSWSLVWRFTTQPGCLRHGDLNNDGVLTPGDALCAFQIYLNNGNLPASCAAANSVCELIAADVSCDGSVTPGDALAIFSRYLQKLPPQECFGRTVLSKPQTQRYRLALQPEQIEEGKLKITLRVENPSDLQAFGLQLEYPSERLRFISLARTATTAHWLQLEARAASEGVLNIGGFHEQAIASHAPAALFEIIFSNKGHAASTSDFKLSGFTDDLSEAFVANAENDLRQLAGVPAQFALHQNYPNPFGAEQSTVLRFDLPGEEVVPVELTIFNLSGSSCAGSLPERARPVAMKFHGMAIIMKVKQPLRGFIGIVCARENGRRKSDS